MYISVMSSIYLDCNNQMIAEYSIPGGSRFLQVSVVHLAYIYIYMQVNKNKYVDMLIQKRHKIMIEMKLLCYLYIYII